MVEIYISLWPNFLIIQDYPTDEILVVYDYDFKYGQNFYCAITEEAKEKILNVIKSLYRNITIACMSNQFYWFFIDLLYYAIIEVNFFTRISNEEV